MSGFPEISTSNRIYGLFGACINNNFKAAPHVIRRVLRHFVATFQVCRSLSYLSVDKSQIYSVDKSWTQVCSTALEFYCLFKHLFCCSRKNYCVFKLLETQICVKRNPGFLCTCILETEERKSMRANQQTVTESGKIGGIKNWFTLREVYIRSENQKIQK